MQGEIVIIIQYCTSGKLWLNNLTTIIKTNSFIKWAVPLQNLHRFKG